jgi:ribonuclease Z
MSNVRVSFLGTGAGQCIYRAHTAIVLDWASGTRVLLDAGSGNSVLKNGAELGILAQDLHLVLLSHQHGDHMGGLPHIQGQRTMITPDAPPLQVYASEQALERVQRLFWATSITHSVDEEGVTTADGRKVVSWLPSQEDAWIDLQNGVRAFSFPVDHIPGAVGWRVESDGVSVVFSGDTRFCPRLAEAAQGATALIHEVLGTESDKDGARRRGHSTAAEAAQAASEAGVDQLIITHIDSPFHLDPQPLVDEAAKYFDGPISVASDLYQVTIGS